MDEQNVTEYIQLCVFTYWYKQTIIANTYIHIKNILFGQDIKMFYFCNINRFWAWKIMCLIIQILHIRNYGIQNTEVYI
jgi:hypothetical protein